MPSSTPFSASADEEAIEDEKHLLREAGRATRQRRRPGKKAEAAQAISGHLLGLPEIASARCVSIYASLPDEPGTLPTIEALAARGVRVLIPVLGDGLRRCWGEFQGADDLVQRAPGRPPEPSGDALPQDALAAAEVVVVPALAVDRVGVRLGQGGGWYDRVLADARPDALVVAIAFSDELRVASHPLPCASHDVPVHAVVTPRGVTRFV